VGVGGAVTVVPLVIRAIVPRVVVIRIGETHLFDATVGFRMGADCFPDDVGLARCDLRTEAE